MARRGRGAIINVASTAAFQPLPGQATYAATKAFVLSLSEAVRTELAGSGVTVTRRSARGRCGPSSSRPPGLGDVDDRTPDVIWMSAADVAREGISGAERDKRVVVPGPLNRAGAIAGQHAPRALALPLVRRLWSRVELVPRLEARGVELAGRPRRGPAGLCSCTRPATTSAALAELADEIAEAGGRACSMTAAGGATRACRRATGAPRSRSRARTSPS